VGQKDNRIYILPENIRQRHYFVLFKADGTTNSTWNLENAKIFGLSSMIYMYFVCLRISGNAASTLASLIISLAWDLVFVLNCGILSSESR
jgi:hypothetical protein